MPLSFSSNRVYYGYWIVLAGFITQFFAVGMANYVVGSFMIPMTEEFGWTRAEFTASRSIGQVVMACTGFVIGSNNDRYGGRPFFFVGSFILALAVYSLGSISTLLQWLLLNGLILTIGAALIGNLEINVTLGYWFFERRGREDENFPGRNLAATYCNLDGRYIWLARVLAAIGNCYFSSYFADVGFCQALSGRLSITSRWKISG